MLRISEIKLPLEHADDALRDAILAKLQISDDELVRLSMSRRRTRQNCSTNFNPIRTFPRRPIRLINLSQPRRMI